jgi:hypothetical protein
MAETKTLPSIQKLASDAWELFKKTWTVYLKLVLLAIAFIFLAILIGILIILPISFVAVGSHFQLFNQLTPFNIATFILFIFWLVLFFVSLLAIQIAYPIAGVFILQGKKTSPIFDLIKATKPYFWPYFLVVLLSAFLTVGGMILLVIPGFLIAFFFSFVLYEVVIDGHKGKIALKHSYFMVKNNFWEVLVRLVVLEVAIIIVTSILNRVAAGDSLLGLVSFLFSLFASWYARAYTFLLYKEVRAKTTFPSEISINWIWIVSLIGWVLVILLILAGTSGLMHPSHMKDYNSGAV